MILEHNHKENETYVFYCQWTGNEEELEMLAKVIETAECELSGDYSSFEVSRIKIPESAVDAHVKIQEFGCYIHMFQKCEGTFLCPEFSNDPFEKAARLDDLYYLGRLREDFSETRKRLLEERKKWRHP